METSGNKLPPNGEEKTVTRRNRPQGEGNPESIAEEITVDLSAGQVLSSTAPDETVLEGMVIDPDKTYRLNTELATPSRPTEDKGEERLKSQRTSTDMKPQAFTPHRPFERVAPLTKLREHLLETGEIVNGKYRVIEFLGRGGMGEVYKVLHMELDQLFAMKLMLSDIPSAHRRFLDEAKTAMELVHEHAVQVRDVGTTEQGYPYFTMDFSRGLTLQKILERDRILTEERALRIIRQVLSALNVLHTRRDVIVHRDLKPANVMIENRNHQDHALVLDFGIAKAVTADVQDNTIMAGTPYYMPPEQILGGKLDHRSDHYAVAVMLYELVTGQRPFHACSTQALISSRLSQRPSPRKIKPDISVGVENIIWKAMSPDIEERFATTENFIRAIDEFLKAPNNSPLRMKKRRKFSLRRIAGGMALLLFLAAVVFAAVPANYLEMADRHIAPDRRYLSQARQHLKSGVAVIKRYVASRPHRPRERQEEPPPSTAPKPDAPAETVDNAIEYLSLLFYERGEEDLPRPQRRYQTYFPKSGTRYVYYELFVKNLLWQKRDNRVTIRDSYRGSDGKLFGRELERRYEISNLLETTCFTDGRGWGAPNQWQPGIYRVDILVGNRKIAQKSFIVYDESKAVECQALRLFEGGATAPSPTQRVYLTRFSKKSTRSVYFELTIKNNLWRLEDHLLQVTGDYYRPDGGLLHSVESSYPIPAGHEYCVLKSAFGWDNPGQWRVGDYRLEVSINGKKAAETAFAIAEDEVEKTVEFQSARLFESVDGAVDLEKRSYATQFRRLATRGIYYEAKVKNRLWRIRDNTIKASARYYDPDGELMGVPECSCTAPSSMEHIYLTGGWGWKYPGYWPLGKYRIEMFVEGEKVEEITFDITK